MREKIISNGRENTFLAYSMYCEKLFTLKILYSKSSVWHIFNIQHLTFPFLFNVKNGIFYYRRTVELRPGSAEPYLNLGAILHLRGKLTEAETAYLEARRLQPGQQNIKINLERLHNLMRKKNMKIRDNEN